MGVMRRRDFVRSAAAGSLAAVAAGPRAFGAAPAIITQKTLRPVVISDRSGIAYKNGGAKSCVETAFERIVRGEDVLDALIAGVNIVENDPEEPGVGYGAVPNAEGVVQLDASCMHGPRKRAGGVAAIEGVRTPSLVAKAVMDFTDHHLLVGKGAQDFARNLGFEIEDDITTDASRKRWLEWKQRIDPEHYLDPEKRAIRGYEAALQMLREGLLEESHMWGTIHCNAINSRGEIAGVTSTSGLSFKIPGRTGDSPILGAGIYVDNDVGACGSTGRGEANLYNLTSFLIVENMRRGAHPKDATLEGLKRIQANTVEKRLLNGRGLPNFNIRFFALNAKGEYAGATMYRAEETIFAVCDENGPREEPLEPLLEGAPTD
ncbi:MAG TPA: N(4)-(beta-N-acetylglucosaminyl)-L-asparaginase [Vicinamibacteria bacterium]|nr:N(4)-(beta-N-acetylglucosaminyl)-L-asparaginase [Vicinamibacteria bacterium]